VQKFLANNIVKKCGFTPFVNIQQSFCSLYFGGWFNCRASYYSARKIIGVIRWLQSKSASAQMVRTEQNLILRHIIAESQFVYTPLTQDNRQNTERRLLANDQITTAHGRRCLYIWGCALLMLHAGRPSRSDACCVRSTRHHDQI
jgi:hypothetical protein